MPVLVGLDCGGTSTKLIAVDSSSNLVLPRNEIQGLVSHEFGSGNFSSLGHEGMGALASEIAGFVRNRFEGKDINVFAGVAGVETPSQAKDCENVFTQSGFSRVIIQNDCEMLVTALGGNAVAVIAGTGSNCYGRKADLVVQDGGYGPRIAENGSGFDIGLRAVLCTIAHLQGRGEEASRQVSDCICEVLEISSVKEFFSIIYTSDSAYVPRLAALAPVIFELAGSQNNKLAQEIISTSAIEFAKQIANVCRQLELTTPKIGLQGGIFRNLHCESLYLPRISEVLQEQGAQPEFKYFGTGQGQVDPLLSFIRNLQ